MKTYQHARFKGLLFCALVLGASCRSREATNIEPVYDQLTGKLQLLKYDSNGNGKVDTWSYMDGTRILRIEIDKDEDGKLDRWEYYDANQKLERTGTSRANDGKDDAWSHVGPDGSIVRVDVSTKRDGLTYYRDTIIFSRDHRLCVRRNRAHLSGRTLPQAAAGYSEYGRRKLEYLRRARTLRDLLAAPGNRLEALKADRAGQHSIRINDQWRICFVWRGSNAEQVEIVDYH